MEIAFEDKKIIIKDEHRHYSEDIQKYFLDYFNAVETTDNVLDFTKPKLFNLKEFDIPVWITGFTESIPTLKNQYIDTANLSEGSIVIDGGAFMGITAMLFSDIVGKNGKVISIEADPINYHYANKNIENYIIKNNFGPTLLNYALWDSISQIEFSSESNMGSSAIEYVGSRSQTVTVNTVTLSEIAHQFNLSKVDYVKLDIEGSEIRAINDGDFFITYTPKVFIEFHDILGENGFNYIINKLTSYGYSYKLSDQASSYYKIIEASIE